jgi:hypothetical protein
MEISTIRTALAPSAPLGVTLVALRSHGHTPALSSELSSDDRWGVNRPSRISRLDDRWGAGRANAIQFWDGRRGPVRPGLSRQAAGEGVVPAAAARLSSVAV